MGKIFIYNFRKKLTIQYYALVGVKKMAPNSGCYKIVGEINGEKVVISEWLEVLMNLL